MFTLVLVSALVVQLTIAAPSNCGDLCENQSSSSYGSKSSYSSYSKSSYGQQMQRLSSGSGLGLTGGRLENLDENVVGGFGTSGLERPGNWQDEKHYVTDDGRGQMSYRAGQTVSDNGFSKFAEHSYRYGTHDSHAPLSNSQILTTSEFNRELQNMRNRISSFMGNFHFTSDSVLNTNLLQDFKNKASLINSQLNNVCNQVDVGSSMYQQMQQVMQQFQRDVEQKQREMEAIIFQSSSTSSTSITHGSIQHQIPVQRPVTQYQPIQQYHPTVPTIDENVIAQQRVEEELTKVQNLISTFYRTFNRPEASAQYQENLNTQVNLISQRLTQLNFETVQNESIRQLIDNLKTQFNEYVVSVRSRIEDLDRRQKEEQLRLKQQQEQEELRQRELQEQQLKLQQQLKEQQELHQQQLQQQQLREQQLREQQLREQQLQIQQQQLQLQQQQQLQLQQQQQQQQQQQHRPLVTGTLEVKGSSSYEHTIKGSYSTPVQSTSNGATESYIHGGQGSRTHYQPIIQPHVDLTAAMNRLQQDLHRLQNEVNQFNTYKMRLTASNSATLVSEAESRAESLRQSINNLCESSNRYQNQNIQTSAEELKSRFEELFQSFQNQVANYASHGNIDAASGFSASSGYSSESSYGASGKYGTYHAPAITNVEYEHAKSTEVEIGRRPASSQRLSSGSSYGSASGYNSHSSYGSGSSYSGRSNDGSIICVDDTQCDPSNRRYKRDVEENFGNYYGMPRQNYGYNQKRPYVEDDSSEYINKREYDQFIPELEDFTQQHVKPNFDALPYDAESDESQESDSDESSQFRVPVVMPREHQPIRNNYHLHRNDGLSQSHIRNSNSHHKHHVEDFTYQQGVVDDYYSRYNSRQNNHAPTSQNVEDNGKLINLSQQSIQNHYHQLNTPIGSEGLSQHHVNFGQIEELESLQQPRSFNYESRKPDSQIHLSETIENSETRQKNENLSQQNLNIGQKEEIEFLQKPRNLNFEPLNLHTEIHTPVTQAPNWEQKTDDLSQQHINLEQSIELKHPEKSRNIDKLDDSEQSQHTQSSKITEHIQTENPQAVKPLQMFDNTKLFEVTEQSKINPLILSLKKSESDKESSELTLQNSGFNDYPQYIEKPVSTTEALQTEFRSPVEIIVPKKDQVIATFGKSRFDEKTEIPDIIKPLSNLSQKSEEFILKNSGFFDNPQKREKNELIDNSDQMISKSKISREIENFDLNNSGFIDYSNYNMKPKLNENSEVVQLEDLTHQQQNNFDSSLSGKNLHNESDLTQQAAQQIDFGTESQAGRQFSQQRNTENNHRISHPIGKNIEILSQSSHEPVDTIQIFNSDVLNQQIQNVNREIEKNPTTTENTRLLLTIRPTVKPAPKPIPTYSRPWQISEIQNDQRNVKNNSIEEVSQNHNKQNDSNKHSAPLRGDLPGYSEPETSTPEPIEEWPDKINNEKPITNNDSEKQHEEVNLQEKELHNLPKSTIDWVQRTNEKNNFYHKQLDIQEKELHNLPKSRTDWVQMTNEQNNFHHGKELHDLQKSNNDWLQINNHHNHFNQEKQLHELQKSRNDWVLNNSEHNRLKDEKELHDLQKSTNEWVQSNSQQNHFSQSNQNYYYNQHSAHHNYKYSQESNYFRPNNGAFDQNQQIQLPLNQQNNMQYYPQNNLLNPINLNENQQSLNQYHESQKSNLQIEAQIRHESNQPTFRPVQFEHQNNEYQFNRPIDFGQQIQQPRFGQQPVQLELNQKHERFSLLEQTSQEPENDFAERVIPLGETRPIDILSESETITTPRTIWKRIGQKLSSSYETVKERARTIFG